MISDILSEAIEHIRDYEKRDPEYYNGLLTEGLNTVLTVMEAMLTALDTPPVPPYEEQGNAILATIQRIDLSELRRLLPGPIIDNKQPIAMLALPSTPLHPHQQKAIEKLKQQDKIIVAVEKDTGKTQIANDN